MLHFVDKHGKEEFSLPRFFLQYMCNIPRVKNAAG